jgi:hypothetical protein
MHTMHENSLWKGVYYDALVSRNLPIGMILLVLTAHYACCAGITRHDVGSTREMFIETPLHRMKRNLEPHKNASTPNKTTHENWNIRDPLSFIYDSCVTLTQDRSETLNAPDESNVNNTSLKGDAADDHSGMMQVCVMHAISLGSFIALWLPTTYTNFSTRSSALWTIGSISVCCSFTSWALCMGSGNIRASEKDNSRTNHYTRWHDCDYQNKVRLTTPHYWSRHLSNTGQVEKRLRDRPACPPPSR